jgi:ribosomal protein S18 acetylase RimI-like enzyme
MGMSNQNFRNASLTDATRCFEIETLAYDGDEAATHEKISKRIVEYPQGFLILEVDNQIVGFVNSGCAYDVEMSDEDFKELIGHDPVAPNVVIMSVVVDPAHQGLGLSTALMSEFVKRMTDAKKETIHLMCKEHHVPLYEKFGYRYTQPSASDHGGVRWHEMMMDLRRD